jgi:hypothetical protein
LTNDEEKQKINIVLGYSRGFNRPDSGCYVRAARVGRAGAGERKQTGKIHIDIPIKEWTGTSLICETVFAS